MNTTKRDSLVSQTPSSWQRSKAARSASGRTTRQRHRRPRSPHGLPGAPQSQSSGLEATQESARRRRIGKRKGPGDHEPQRYDVEIFWGSLGPGPLGVTGPTTAGILGTIVSILIIIALVFPLFLTSFLPLLSSSLQPFPGPWFLILGPERPRQVKTTPSLVGESVAAEGAQQSTNDEVTDEQQVWIRGIQSEMGGGGVSQEFSPILVQKYLAKSLCLTWLCWCSHHAACITN